MQDGDGLGIREKYGLKTITNEQLKEIVRNIAAEYGHSEKSILHRLQELGVNTANLSESDFIAILKGRNGSYETLDAGRREEWQQTNNNRSGDLRGENQETGFGASRVNQQGINAYFNTKALQGESRLQGNFGNSESNQRTGEITVKTTYDGTNDARYQNADNERVEEWNKKGWEEVAKELGAKSAKDFLDNTRFFRTKEGTVYGFVYKGEIYLDPDIADANAVVHEYTHLWAEMTRQKDTKFWDDIKQKMRKLPVWKEITQNPAYANLKSEDSIAEEVLATYSGRRGNERINEMMQRIDREMPNKTDREVAKTALQKLRNVLNEFWKKVGELFHIKNKTPEQIADMVLTDLLNGVNPNASAVTLGEQNQSITENISRKNDDIRMMAASSTQGDNTKTVPDAKEQAKWVQQNKESLLSTYRQKQEERKQSNVIDPDEVRKLLAPLGYTVDNIPSYKEAGDWLTTEIFKEQLKQAVAQGKTTFTIVAGAPASGKSTATRGEQLQKDLKESGVVYDAPFNSLSSYQGAIEEARKAGIKNINVIIVYNDPATTISNSIQRAINTGRTCPLSYMLGCFAKNIGKIQTLQELYGDSVNFKYIDNAQNNGGREVSHEEALQWNYEITDELFETFKQKVKENEELTERQKEAILQGVPQRNNVGELSETTEGNRGDVGLGSGSLLRGDQQRVGLSPDQSQVESSQDAINNDISRFEENEAQQTTNHLNVFKLRKARVDYLTQDLRMRKAEGKLTKTKAMKVVADFNRSHGTKFRLMPDLTAAEPLPPSDITDYIPTKEKPSTSDELNEMYGFLKQLFPGIKMIVYSPELFAATKTQRGLAPTAEAFIQGDTIAVPNDLQNVDILIEEYIHPFMRMMERERPDIFIELLEDAQTHFPQLHKDIEETYFEFSQATRNQELVTQALSRHFREQTGKGHTEHNAFNDLVKRFIRFVQDLLGIQKSLKGRKNVIIPLNQLKSIYTLADMATVLNTEGISFDVSSEFGNDNVTYHLGTEETTNNTEAVSQFVWARTSTNNYEVSSAGDKRFSALYATFKPGTIIEGQDVGGKTIENVYQKVIKKSGKGKAPSGDSMLNIEQWAGAFEGTTNDLVGILPKELIDKMYDLYFGDGTLTKQDFEDFSYYVGYLPLWQKWAEQNPDLIQELKQMAAGKVLTDKFASTRVSQARALTDILNTTQGEFGNDNVTYHLETEETASNNVEVNSSKQNNYDSEQIFNHLPGVHQSKRIQIVSNPNSHLREQENKLAVVAYRTRTTDQHFGNPFMKRAEDGENVKNFIDWITTDKFANVEPNRRAWIISQLNDGWMKGKPIYYGNTDAAKKDARR